jgi:hypothetical protein
MVRNEVESDIERLGLGIRNLEWVVKNLFRRTLTTHPSPYIILKHKI